MQLNIDTAATRPLRIVQLTDTHLGEAANSTLLAMDTDASLEHVLDMVAALDGEQAPDLIIVTGDIADAGARGAYERLQAKLAKFSQPKLWLAGNHDSGERMRDVVGFGAELERRIISNDWQIVMLDSAVPAEVHGMINRANLEFLRRCLQTADGRHTLLCVHHQLVPVGCGWLDEQIVSNASELFGVIRGFSSVRGIISGHVHQQFDTQQFGVRLLSTPSTCVQFAPGEENFAVDPQAPGYRWLELHADGSIETSVRRVEGVEFTVDLNSQGYLDIDAGP